MSFGMPQATEQHRRLSALEGKWSGVEKLYPSPWGPGGAATGRMTSRVDVDGFFLVQDYEEEKDGRVVFRGHGVMGYDPQEQSYLWYWFDSMGSPPKPSRGNWEGDTLTFHSESPAQRSRYTYRFENADRYSFKIEGSRDGVEWMPFMEATYTRLPR
jgi:uncharacterized protein DUF1579